MTFEEFNKKYTEVDMTFASIKGYRIGIYLLNGTDLHFVKCEKYDRDFIYEILDDIMNNVSNDHIHIQKHFYSRNWVDLSRYTTNKTIIFDHNSNESYYIEKYHKNLSKEEINQLFLANMNDDVVSEIRDYMEGFSNKINPVFFEGYPFTVDEIKERVDNYINSIEPRKINPKDDFIHTYVEAD